MEQPDVAETERLQKLYAGRVAGRTGSEPHASPDAILAVVTREGSEEERLATLEHVMACAECHREYQWLTAVNEAGVEAEGSAGAAPRRSRWLGAPMAMAASLLVAIGVGVVLSGVFRSADDRERGGGASADIALVGPADRASIAGPIVFVWHAAPGVSRYVLEVQRADGSVALADTTADTSATVTDLSRLRPDSAYRWWVREATDGAEPRSSAFRDLRLSGR
ncbi:MAG TPA: hypothetical protein VFJ81_09765 [Gemmatimonadales bacterium]|nr:hypothetical protein [Gemmatimonadales bacterium]